MPTKYRPIAVGYDDRHEDDLPDHPVADGRAGALEEGVPAGARLERRQLEQAAPVGRGVIGEEDREDEQHERGRERGRRPQREGHDVGEDLRDLAAQRVS